MTMCDDVSIFLIPSQTKFPSIVPSRSRFPSGHAVAVLGKLYHFLPSPRRRPGAIAPQGLCSGSRPGMTKGGGIRHYLHHDLDSGVKPRNDTYESVCGKNSVFLSSPRRRPGAIAPQGHLYMHYYLDSGVRPRNDTYESVRDQYINNVHKTKPGIMLVK